MRDLQNSSLRKGKRGAANKTLFIQHFDSSFTIVQIYMDDIVFRSISNSKVLEFVNHMQKEFEISMVGSLQIK